MKFYTSATLATITLGLVLGFGPASGPAHAESFLNYVLPSVFGPPDEGPKPEDTLQAPFGKDRPAPVQNPSQTQAGLMNMYEDQPGSKKLDILSEAHRSSSQVGDWLSGIVTQALSINPSEYKPETFSGYFTPYALQEYNTYLSSNQVMEGLKANHLKLSAFAEGKATMIQEGQLEGYYRWVFRVPVMLTYYDQSAKTLKGAAPSQTQRVSVNVQISRVPLKQAADGMVIERWSVSSGG